MLLHLWMKRQGVIQNDNKYVNQRYGNKTINLVDRVFSHGNFDYKNLITKYSKSKKKIINSGNPRFDFWRKISKNFLKNIDYIKKKNYLLISSNLKNIFAYIKIERRLSIHKEAGYSKRGLSQKFITEDSKTSQKLLKKILEFLNIINDNFQKFIRHN